MVLFVVIIVATFLAVILEMQSIAQRADLCASLDKLIGDEQILHVYYIHTAARSTYALSISAWLIYIAIQIRRILDRTLAGDNFQREKQRMDQMNWTFIFSFTAWTVYEIYLCAVSFRTGFWATESYYWFCVVSDLVPISVAFYTHLKNTHQANRIFLMSWGPQRDEVDMLGDAETNNLVQTQEAMVVYLEGTDIVTEQQSSVSNSGGSTIVPPGSLNTNAMTG